MFVRDRPFQPSQKFEGKAEAYLREEQLKVGLIW
jgi:hypothetical protein